MEIAKRKAFIINFIYFAIILALAVAALKYVLPMTMPFVMGFVIAYFLQRPRNFLADKLGVSRKTISLKIKSLKEKGILQRIGSDTKGYWKIYNE